VAAVDIDSLRPGDGRVDSAHAPDVNEALFGDEVDRHGDLIGVGRQHEPWRTAFVQPGDRIPVSVRLRFVCVTLDVIEPHSLPARFESRGAWSVNQFLQEGQRLVTHGREDRQNRGWKGSVLRCVSYVWKK